MGKEKDKKPLFGGIFQKFFKPSAKAEAKKKKEHHLTVQRSIPYLEMGRDGICRVEEHLYSKTVRFYDINYQLAQNEDKNTIFESWCDFLNYFDSSIRFQLSFINHKSDMSEYNKVIQIEPQHDQFDAAIIYGQSVTPLEKRLKARICELCGTTESERYEIHHINKLKNLKGKEPWEIAMLAKRRKTLVVCEHCHHLIHNQ